MVDAVIDRNVAVNIRKVPFSLRQRFKIWCTREGMTLTEGITYLMEDAVVMAKINGPMVDSSRISE